MKLDAEHFRQHYRTLSDGELTALDPADLTDVARGCYNKELERRGLSGVTARLAALETPEAGDGEPEEPVEQADWDEPVSLGHVSRNTPMRAILRVAGIPSYLEDEYTPAFAGGARGCRLMVPAARFEEARAVLDEISQTEPLPTEPWDGKIHHRFIETNGIRMHYAEAGSGRLVLLCHGFPESWRAWRHQLGALAEAGYRAVAPDLRGYGQSDRPEALEAYDIFQLTGDIVGLANAISLGPSVIVGHDWGAWLASHAALLRPDLFCGVALLSVPFVPRRLVNQTEWERQTYPGKTFYQAALRSPDAEQYFTADIRSRLLTAFWTLSGEATDEIRWQPTRDAGAPPRQPEIPSALPPWLRNQDLDFLVSEYQRTGFTGGLNYYRNMDRNWALTSFLDGARLLHRTLFLTGEKDPVLDIHGEEFEDLETNVPNLWRKQLIRGAGHWIQQERPEEVNRILLAFLRDIEAGERA